MKNDILNIDEFSGNPIRPTDNTMRDNDIFSPQDPRVLELDPETKLPKWWNDIRDKRSGNGNA